MATQLDDVLGRSMKRTLAAFQEADAFEPEEFKDSVQVKTKAKILAEYTIDAGMQQPLPQQQQAAAPQQLLMLENGAEESKTGETQATNALSSALVARPAAGAGQSRAVVARRQPPKVEKPQWHAPWEMLSVVSGHLGWVRSIAFDPSNEWFATGSADRTIKIWDLAKCAAGAEGGLKLTLTGHISAIRGLAVSPRHPYLFSAGEDKKVLCWDLEYNKAIRHYHGHLSGVYCLALHPTLDILITGGRDSVARVWDMRTKHEIMTLGGHDDAVASLITNAVDPQVMTGSHDHTIRLWDLAAGRAMTTLTHHKKSIRAMARHPRELTFVSGAADTIKKWQVRDGVFLKNLDDHNAVINALAVNEDDVMVSCADNGSMNFWDYKTGYCFQKTSTIAQPGSLDAETGVFAATFDLTGSRLITCEADKTIKIWKENDEATEETHPIDMKGWTKKCQTIKRF